MGRASRFNQVPKYKHRTRVFMAAGKTYELNFITLYKGSDLLAIPLPPIPDPKLTKYQQAYIRRAYWSGEYHLVYQKQNYERAVDEIAYAWADTYKFKELTNAAPRFGVERDRDDQWWLLFKELGSEAIDRFMECANTTIPCRYCKLTYNEHQGGRCLFVQGASFSSKGGGVRFLDLLPAFTSKLRRVITRVYRQQVQDELRKSLDRHRREVRLTRNTINALRRSRLKMRSGRPHLDIIEDARKGPYLRGDLTGHDLVERFKQDIAYIQYPEMRYRRIGQTMPIDKVTVELAKAILAAHQKYKRRK